MRNDAVAFRSLVNVVAQVEYSMFKENSDQRFSRINRTQGIQVLYYNSGLFNDVQEYFPVPAREVKYRFRVICNTSILFCFRPI